MSDRDGWMGSVFAPDNAPVDMVGVAERVESEQERDERVNRLLAQIEQEMSTATLFPVEVGGSVEECPVVRIRSKKYDDLWAIMGGNCFPVKPRSKKFLLNENEQYGSLRDILGRRALESCSFLKYYW